MKIPKTLPEGSTDVLGRAGREREETDVYLLLFTGRVHFQYLSSATYYEQRWGSNTEQNKLSPQNVIFMERNIQ